MPIWNFAQGGDEFWKLSGSDLFRIHLSVCFKCVFPRFSKKTDNNHGFFFLCMDLPRHKGSVADFTALFRLPMPKTA